MLETLYSKEEPQKIVDSLIEGQQGNYSYEIKKYLQREAVRLDEKEFTLESLYIQVHYQIAGEAYVSIFAINTVQEK